MRLFLFAPWLLIIAIVGLLWWSITHVQEAAHHKGTCQMNLIQIYKAVELYTIEHKTLPSLAFYPDSPQRGTDSMIRVLRNYGLDPACTVCPATPDPVRWTGLSYVWNPSLNGKRFEDFQDPVWMVVDIQAVSTEVPAPHLGTYLVLYSDGTILETQEPPAVLRR